MKVAEPVEAGTVVLCFAVEGEQRHNGHGL